MLHSHLLKTCVLIIMTLNTVNLRAGLVEDILKGKLPKGVPERTTSNGKCFLSHEMDELKKIILSNKNTLALNTCSERFIKAKKSVKGNIYYVPGTNGSITDCKKYRQNKYHGLDLSMAVEQTVDYADINMNSSNSEIRNSAANCLAEVFHHWAKTGAMTKPEVKHNDQPYYYQMWYSGAMAATYLKYNLIQNRIRKKGYLPKVKKWLSTIATTISNRITRPAGSPYGINNMQYARGFSLLAISLITQNKAGIELSYSVFNEAMSKVTNGNIRGSEKGYLPAELQRKNRALAYHVASLKHLLGILTLSKAFDCSFMNTDSKRWSMALLMRKIIEGRYYPEVFDEASYKHLNSIGKPTDKASVVQTQSATAENLIDLLGYGEDRIFIVPIIDDYLAQKRISRRTDFNDNWFRDTKLGGDFRYLPSESSLKISGKPPKFCKGKKNFDLEKKFFSID